MQSEFVSKDFSPVLFLAVGALWVLQTVVADFFLIIVPLFNLEHYGRFRLGWVLCIGVFEGAGLSMLELLFSGISIQGPAMVAALIHGEINSLAGVLAAWVTWRVCERKTG